MEEYPLFTVVMNYGQNEISHLETSFSKILDCNTAFAKSIGYTREELVGKPIGLINKKANKFSNLDFTFKKKRLLSPKKKREILSQDYTFHIPERSSLHSFGFLQNSAFYFNP